MKTLGSPAFLLLHSRSCRNSAGHPFAKEPHPYHPADARPSIPELLPLQEEEQHRKTFTGSVKILPGSQGKLVGEHAAARAIRIDGSGRGQVLDFANDADVTDIAARGRRDDDHA